MAVRRRGGPGQLARRRRGRGTSTTRRTSCSAPRCRPAARSGCRRTPPTTRTYAIDFINLEQVAPVANPDPARYADAGRLHPAGRAERARPGPAGHHRHLVGVYLPAGDYQTASKFKVYGKAIKVIGAGPWYTRFDAPAAPGEHRRRLPRPSGGQRLDVHRVRLLRQLHHPASTARARCATSPTSRT